VSAPYDFAKERERIYSRKKAASDYEARYFAEQKMKEEGASSAGAPSSSISRHCPLCGYGLEDEWKFCPECGVSLIKK
jgi:hypothetical protein